MPLSGRNRQAIRHLQWIARQVPGSKVYLTAYLKESYINIGTYNSVLNSNGSVTGAQTNHDVGQEQRLRFRINN